MGKDVSIDEIREITFMKDRRQCTPSGDFVHEKKQSGKRPRILHVTQCFEAGVAQAILNIAGTAPKYDHVLLARGREMDRAVGKFSEIYPLPEGLLKGIQAVRSAVRNTHPCLVHAHSSWAGVYTRAVPLPVPVVYQPHCYAMAMSDGISSQFFGAVEHILARNSAVTVAVSPWGVSYAKEVAPSNAIRLLPNLPSTPVRDGGISDSVNSDRPSVAMSGRICAQKDPAFFAEVARAVHADNPKISFKWIGAGSSPELVSILKEAGVEILGWQRDQQLLDAIDSSTIYFHCAKYEGFPQAVLDAFARGVPVIVRDIPAFDGSQITRIDSVEEASRLIQQVLHNPKEFQPQFTVERQKMLRTHTPAALGAAVDELYAIFGSTRG